MALIVCPTCHKADNVVATYAHTIKGGAIHSWTKPMPDSVPAPEPCPTDGITCARSSVDCKNCGWHQP